MFIKRPWAFWRRAQYAGGVVGVVLLCAVAGYVLWWYTPPLCDDGRHNGDERGVDCGGSCVRICAFDAHAPVVEWARSFEVVAGQYNAVAYITNTNQRAGIARLPYTFSLYDAQGLIVERHGTTVLPPNGQYPLFEGRILTGDRVPVTTILTFGDIDYWLPAQVGREQFVVEGRTLTDAGTQPRLTAQLTNTALAPVRDVEVVATIFDSRGTALTASRTIVPEIAGRATNDIVFTWPQPIAHTLRSCEVPTDVVLALDLSGSMNDDGGTPPEPITSVINAATAFIDRLHTGDRVAVVTYATTASIREPLSTDHASVRRAVASLAIDPQEERGSTNTGEALAQAGTALASDAANPNARKVAVLLTDGRANAPADNPEAYAQAAAADIRSFNADIFTIGLGRNVNEEFLEAIASGPQYYFTALSAAEIDSIYRSVTRAICEDGPAVIDIVPKFYSAFEGSR